MFKIQNDETKQAPSSGVVIPNRLMNKPLVNEINFFQDQQQQQQSSSASKGPRVNNNNKSFSLPIVEEPIDPNLIDALQKPHERTNVLKIEQMIYNFVYSK